MNKKIIPIKVDLGKFNDLKDSLECINIRKKNYIRKGKYVDFIIPAIDKFIESSKANKGFEFIEYIKSWNPNK